MQDKARGCFNACSKLCASSAGACVSIDDVSHAQQRRLNGWVYVEAVAKMSGFDEKLGEKLSADAFYATMPDK
jgi:hypothetical protein